MKLKLNYNLYTWEEHCECLDRIEKLNREVHILHNPQPIDIQL